MKRFRIDLMTFFDLAMPVQLSEFKYKAVTFWGQNHNPYIQYY